MRVPRVLLLIAAIVSLGAAAPSVRVADLDNRLVDPFQNAAGVKATVFIFTSVECPISNRYAPVVQNLHRTFAEQGVKFWLVYPNPADSADAIRAHIKTFGYPVAALRDTDHQLASLAQATVTPEAAVYNGQGSAVYRGRIDDRYVSVGVERPSPTRHDLADALAATLAGKAIAQPTTQAVGCFISDFVR
jgi:hypothetical protein